MYLLWDKEIHILWLLKTAVSHMWPRSYASNFTGEKWQMRYYAFFAIIFLHASISDRSFAPSAMRRNLFKMNSSAPQDFASDTKNTLGQIYIRGFLSVWRTVFNVLNTYYTEDIEMTESPKYQHHSQWNHVKWQLCYQRLQGQIS